MALIRSLLFLFRLSKTSNYNYFNRVLTSTSIVDSVNEKYLKNNFLQMDVEQMPIFLDLYANSGNTLNHEKCNLLMNSLVILQNENHFKKVYFWGQIYGTQEDYYIAFGYGKDAIRGRVFYYSRNGITWVLLPVLKPKDRAHYLAYISSNRFFGNPALKIDILDEQPSDEYAADKRPEEVSEEEGEKLDKLSRDIVTAETALNESTKRFSMEDVRSNYKLKEEDRLAATIRFINQEAAVIPRGFLFKQTNGRVVPNPAFAGLQTEEATILTNYLHYRVPRERWEVNVGRRPDFNYATDFLDTIAEDIPQNNVWSAQVVQGNRAVVLRNLYWPGFTFYHQLNTKIHGFLYMGNGQRNIDLPFMN